jgi:hypothetical protein
MDSSSKGKYSDEGRPPPREMMPGFFRYLAAALRELPLREEASMFRRSEILVSCGQDCCPDWHSRSHLLALGLCL